MFASFSTALSALSATATAVDVVGNNLANLNTTGYKTSVVSFHDLVTQSLGAGLGETQVGLGTGRPLTSRQFTQGAVQASSGLLDAAIQGDGLFLVKDSNDATLFTRAGNFRVDAQGNLLTATKERVQGWTQVDGIVDTSGPIDDIKVPVGALRQPSATTVFSLQMNLDAAGVVGQPSGRISAPMQVFDSLGAAHVLTVSFSKTDNPGEWTYQITIPGNKLDAAATTDPVVLNEGELTFGPDGQLSESPAVDGVIAIDEFEIANGSAPLNVSWRLADATGRALLTQFAQPSAVAAPWQDGISAAQLASVGLGDGGSVLAMYSDGTQKLIGQLALAAIRNPESLIAVGNNNFQASAQTAMPAIGVPNTGGRGKVLGSALEASTVDIAREFTNLIVLQRSYQANARVVTTVDELSQDTINLKR